MATKKNTYVCKLTKIKNETIVYLLCIDYIPTIVLVTGGHIVSIAYPNFFRPGHYTVSNGFFDDHQHLITNHNQSFMPNALLRVLSTTILLWLHTKDQFYFCHDGHTSGKKQALMWARTSSSSSFSIIFSRWKNNWGDAALHGASFQNTFLSTYTSRSPRDLDEAWPKGQEK